jgi:transposase
MPQDLPPWYVVYHQMRRWVVEQNFGWATRFRSLARDYQRLTETLAGLYYLAFVYLMLTNLIRTFQQS